MHEPLYSNLGFFREASSISSFFRLIMDCGPYYLQRTQEKHNL